MSLKHTTLLYARFKVIPFFFLIQWKKIHPASYFPYLQHRVCRVTFFIHDDLGCRFQGGKNKTKTQILEFASFLRLHGPDAAFCCRFWVIFFSLQSVFLLFCFVLGLVTPILLCSLTTSQGSLNITTVGGRQLMRCYSWLPKLVKYLIKTSTLHEATYSAWLTIISVFLHLSH